MNHPLISVVCLCFNHEQFVGEAIHSVLSQTYSNIELIVVDDGSSDSSVQVIEQVIASHPTITFLKLKENGGICAAFNSGFALSKGAFITDFAADDVMMPHRMERLLARFSNLDQTYGVTFSDAMYIDARGKELRYHTAHLMKKRLISKVPEGWIFRDVLERYFICAPSMLVRRDVLIQMNGYDENLAYEDFDFWVRSSREFKYAYVDEVLTKVRVVRGSMSSKLYEPRDAQLHSTFLICKKAIALCRDAEDKKALLRRVRYEFRHAVFSSNHREAKLFGQLEGEIGGHNWIYYLLSVLSKVPLPWFWLRKKYQQLVYS
ncbi:MAG TPA: glycosyltransferase [Cyclobacteriaceae bacterium]|jgi:glycosyltransferase involved in cell wall biosynthesis|nr:glycosyltransferase [Cyclobacteriaceae bacterium]